MGEGPGEGVAGHDMSFVFEQVASVRGLGDEARCSATALAAVLQAVCAHKRNYELAIPIDLANLKIFFEIRESSDGRLCGVSELGDGRAHGEALYGRCKHCDLPLPPPRGSRGRPRDYCPPETGRRCKEEAALARRAAVDAVVAAPQREIAALFDRQLPQLVGLHGLLGEVLGRIGTLQSGVLSRIGEVEAEAEDARADAAEARAAMRDAEQERDQAVTEAKEQVAEARRTARAARDARDEAVRARDAAQEEAVRRVAEADERARAATDKTTEHERARGQAEGERAAALAARDELAARLDATQAQWSAEREQQQARIEKLRSSNAGLAADLVQSRTALAEAVRRAEAAEHAAAQAAASAEAADGRARAAETETQQLRLDLVAAHGETKAAATLLTSAERDRAAARAEAAELRERAATAELLLSQTQGEAAGKEGLR